MYALMRVLSSTVVSPSTTGISRTFFESLVVDSDQIIKVGPSFELVTDAMRTSIISEVCAEPPPVERMSFQHLKLVPK